MSAALPPVFPDENLSMLYHHTPSRSLKMESMDSGKDLLALNLAEGPDKYHEIDYTVRQSSLGIVDVKKESQEDTNGYIKAMNGIGDLKQPKFTDEFCFNLNVDGIFLKWDDRIAWECRRCHPKTLYPSYVDFLCHRVSVHPESVTMTCSVCGELVKNINLSDHFEIHSKNSLCGQKGRNSIKIGEVVGSQLGEDCHEASISDDKCEFQSDDDGFDSDEDCQPLAVLSSRISREDKIEAEEPDSDLDKSNSRPCEHCDKIFEDADQLKEHISRKHTAKNRKRRKSLAFERKSAKRRTGIKSRLKISSDRVTPGMDGEKPKRKHLCSYCGKTFSLSYKLKKHYRVHTGEKPYHCSQCGKNFSSCSNLKRHVLIHSGEKPYLCTFCGKSFNHPTTFKTHSYIHSGPKNLKLKPNLKKYSCEYCSKEFAARSTLTIHIRVHTKERPYHCNTCEKSFSQKSALNQHLLNHTGEKPHTCSYCLKTFKTVVCLKTHVRTHTGERPYKCGVCEKAFSSQSNLYRHRTTHTGIKRFSCDYCGKEFSQRSALGDHINIHTGARPYCCPHCSSCFANKSTLVKHVAIHTMKHVQK